VEKCVKAPVSYLILAGLTNAFVLLLFPLLFSINFIFPWSIYCILLGSFLSIGIYIYMRALQIEEVSRVIPLIYLEPLFVTLIAFFITKEVFSTQKYVGIVVLVISSILISYTPGRKKRFSPALMLILLFDVIYAVYAVVLKYLMPLFNVPSIVFWTSLSFLVTVPILLSVRSIRNVFISDFKSLKRKAWILRLMGMITYWGGLIPFYTAVSLGPISLISAVSSVQPFFVLIFSLFLSLFFPHIIKERFDKSTLGTKLIATCLLFIGNWLVLR